MDFIWNPSLVRSGKILICDGFIDNINLFHFSCLFMRGLSIN